MLQRYLQNMLSSVDTLVTLTGVGSKMIKDPPVK